MIKNYIKIAWRSLVHNKVYSLINIVGLSIGLSAAILILLYVKDEISYDRFHTQSPNIYRVVSDWYHPDGSIGHRDGMSSNLQGPIFKTKIPEIEAFVRYSSVFRDIRAKGEVKGYEMNYTDSNFFSVFDFPMLAGDPKTALVKPMSVVISEEMALKFFNSVEVVGKTLEISSDNQFTPYLITGVTKKCPENSSIKFHFLLPKFVNPEETAATEWWFNFSYHTFVLLNPKANIANVVKKMKEINASDAAQANKIILEKYEIKDKVVFNLQRLQDIHLSTDLPAQYGLLEASNPTYSYILSAITLFILLIACINFVNLTVARSLKRAKEIGVRKVVGSSRKQLIWQFLGESFFLSFIAFTLAILVVQLILPTFNQLANKSLSISYLFDAQLLLGYFLVFVVTSFLAGFYPAMVLSGYSPVKTLYGQMMFSGKSYLQKSLVILQFALASFLIILSFSFYSHFNFLINKDLGYDDSNTIMVEKWDLTKQNAEVLKEQLLKNPNILQLAPKNGENWEDLGKINGGQKLNFGLGIIDEEFLPLYKIPLVRGRNFSKDFPTDSTQSVLVNETFVKKANWKNPLGQIVDYPINSGRKYQVVGIVKDYHYQSLNTEIKPQMFVMQSTGFGFLNIKIKPNTETASIVFIEKTFKDLFPMNAFVYKFKDLENQKAYESEQKWKQIMLFGAILTIFISCIGLFGLATLSAEKRTKEIGVRKVMGASVTSIVKLLSTDFLKLVSLSFIISFPLAYLASQKWLENYPYREVFNWWIFGITAITTIAIALLTVGWQAIRAALMNPVKSLKVE
ncbi:FtsX-like permease family protein [Lacihabitans sp. CCS-44]|uniref:ABC transporter permease n=1 Tax=Lacihabitans sp. CCS-44 TaxID=2487331 RepID=UPI0020CDC116|nr:ABC transporter permease [Lacihabitans sp. CCS-44]MCP9754023.1 FtsX-like permease family protein [Lacihabitans sp. CCS-44]